MKLRVLKTNIEYCLEILSYFYPSSQSGIRAILEFAIEEDRNRVFITRTGSDVCITIGLRDSENRFIVRPNKDGSIAYSHFETWPGEDVISLVKNTTRNPDDVIALISYKSRL